MTGPNPVARVTSLLTSAGYVRRENLLKVASVEFVFAATFTAPRSLDLVVVVDTLVDSEARLLQRLEGLSSALDVVRSRRSITAILVGPPPSRAAQDALLRTGRVLIVGTPVGRAAEEEIRNALAVLLPLQLPPLSDPTAQSWEDLRASLGAEFDAQTIDRLFDAAAHGADAVNEVLRTWVAEPLAGEAS